MPFFDDAPVIDFQDTAETTDFFLYDTSDAPADGASTEAGTWTDTFTDTAQSADGTAGSDQMIFDSEDTFAFYLYGPKDGSATGNNATPVPQDPPEEEPKVEELPWKIDKARHSALMSTIRNTLD